MGLSAPDAILIIPVALIGIVWAALIVLVARKDRQKKRKLFRD